MSTGSLGALGYDDEQAQASWDDGALFWEVTAQQTGPITSPAIDCSRWAAISVSFRVIGNPCYLVLQWYADAALTKSTGQVYLAADNHIVFPYNVSVRNRGPYVQASLEPATGSTVYTPTLRLQLNNRSAAFSGESAFPVQIEGAGSLVSGGQAVLYPFSHSIGNIALGVFAGSQSMTVDVYVLATLTSYLRLFSVALAASAFEYQLLQIPAAGWYVNLTNTGGATNSTYTIVATAT